MKARWLVVAAVGLFLAAGTSYAAMLVLAPREDAAIKLVPPDSSLYVSVFLDPSTDQKLALRSLIGKIPKYDSVEKASDALEDLVDQLFDEADLDFQDDVEPWLGGEVAIFINGTFATQDDGSIASGTGANEPDGAVLVATSDGDAALEAVKKAQGEAGEEYEEASYEGVGYLDYDDGSAVGVVSGFLVFGSDQGFKSTVDASTGRSLDDSTKFRDATEDLSQNRLALAYVDVGDIIRDMRGAGELTSEDEQALAAFQEQYEEPTAAIVFAESDHLVYEQAVSAQGRAREDASPAPVAELPEDAWLALGVNDVGTGVEVVVDQLEDSGIPDLDPDEFERDFRRQTGLDLRSDLLSWIGDVSFFVQGSTPRNVEGGIIIETTDAAASSEAVAKAATALRKQGAPLRPFDAFGDEGFTVFDRSMPKPINVVAGERVVAAFGDNATEDAWDPGSTLAEDALFGQAQDAVGNGYNLSLYLNFPAMLALSDTGMPAFDPGYEDVQPFLESITYVASGSKTEGGTTLQRFVLGVGEEPPVQVGLR